VPTPALTPATPNQERSLSRCAGHTANKLSAFFATDNRPRRCYCSARPPGGRPPYLFVFSHPCRPESRSEALVAAQESVDVTIDSADLARQARRERFRCRL